MMIRYSYLFILFLILSVSVKAQTDTLRILSKNGQVHITSIPEGARVFINDTLIGTTPLNIQGIQKYEKRIKMVKEGFKDWEGSFVSYNDIQNDIIALLDDKAGIVSINSDPRGAEVFVNDSLAGITPIMSLKLKRGKYNLKICKKGYELWESVLNVHPMVTAIFPKLTSSFSYVSFDKNLTVSGILVDGKAVNADSLELRSISTGIHEIEYNIPGTGRTLSETIKFIPDYVYNIRMGSHSFTPLFYSAFIPGSGQIINGSYIKGISILAASIGTGLLAYTSAGNYDKKVDYAEKMQYMYLLSNNETQALYYRDLVLNSRSDAEKALNYKRAAIGAFLGVYLYNLLDALVFEPNNFLKTGVSKIKTEADLGLKGRDTDYRIGFTLSLK